MGYVAMAGLLFAPLVCLLCSAWFFVRWKNEHDDEEQAAKSKKVSVKCLIAAGVVLVVFIVLKLIFPIG